jgi:hypothetical protein
MKCCNDFFKFTLYEEARLQRCQGAAEKMHEIHACAFGTAPHQPPPLVGRLHLHGFKGLIERVGHPDLLV